jgi:hypothetical protein
MFGLVCRSLISVEVYCTVDFVRNVHRKLCVRYLSILVVLKIPFLVDMPVIKHFENRWADFHEIRHRGVYPKFV